MWDLREYHVVDKPREREGREGLVLLVDIDMRYSDVGKVADAVNTSTLFLFQTLD